MVGFFEKTFFSVFIIFFQLIPRNEIVLFLPVIIFLSVIIFANSEKYGKTKNTSKWRKPFLMTKEEIKYSTISEVIRNF